MKKPRKRIPSSRMFCFFCINGKVHFESLDTTKDQLVEAQGEPIYEDNESVSWYVDDEKTLQLILMNLSLLIIAKQSSPQRTIDKSKACVDKTLFA